MFPSFQVRFASHQALHALSHKKSESIPPIIVWYGMVCCPGMVVWDWFSKPQAAYECMLHTFLSKQHKLFTKARSVTWAMVINIDIHIIYYYIMYHIYCIIHHISCDHMNHMSYVTCYHVPFPELSQHMWHHALHTISSATRRLTRFVPKTTFYRIIYQIYSQQNFFTGLFTRFVPNKTFLQDYLPDLFPTKLFYRVYNHIST